MAPVGVICLVVNWLMLEMLYRKPLSAAAKHWQQTAAPMKNVDPKLAFKSVCTLSGLIMAFLVGVPMDIAALAAATVLLVWAQRCG
jgi:Na+/H+ antiporter NhaD/arsenite permease-like protein